MSTLTKIAVCCLIALVTVVIASRSDHASAASSCDLVAASNGSDSAPGTEAAPLKTVKALLDDLESGQTGCVRGGTYVEDKFLLKTPDVTLTSFPGERATLRGHLRFNVTAVGATVEGFNLDGRNPGDPYGPLIYADDVVLRDNDITNEHTAVCVLVDDYSTSPGAEAGRDREQRHSRLRQAACHQPRARHLRVTRRRHGDQEQPDLRKCRPRRPALPRRRRSVVTGNVIDGNGEGMIFGGGSEFVVGRQSRRGERHNQLQPAFQHPVALAGPHRAAGTSPATTASGRRRRATTAARRQAAESRR